MFLETTMISSKKYRKNPALIKAKEKDVINQMVGSGHALSLDNKAALLDFLSAVISGNNTYTKNFEKYGENGVSLFDVRQYREYIKPIPELNRLASE